MSTATEIVQRAYEAFGRGDVPAILGMLADDVDWELAGSPNLPYAGKRRSHAEVGEFFADVARADRIHVFEPREYIDAGNHVTVLGYEKSTALETGKEFESEWIHGKVTRWRGFFNTAARYGY
jgi:ketosteroid isomerase-like protein